MADEAGIGEKIVPRGAAALLVLLFPAAVLCASGAPPSQRDEAPPETVYLLHGMGRSRLSMTVLAARLKRNGFRVVNFPYSQASEPLAEISNRLRARVAGDAPARYHFVTHSLGGIIVRDGFREGYPPGLGRIVMLAPPNRPPLLAKGLKNNPLYKLWAGDSGRKLAEASFYERLPVPAVPFGVVAGTRGNGFLAEEKNDGIILVETTRLKGMADFKEVPHSHTFLMNSSDTARLVLDFLRLGSF